MTRKRSSVPAYLHHKATGQARCRIAGKDHYLGPYGSESSRIRYGQLVAKLAGGVPIDPLASSKRGRTTTIDPEADPGPTVGELCLAFMRYAETHYRKNGEKTTGGITGLPTTVDWLIVRLNHLLRRLSLEPLHEITLRGYVALVEASLKSGDGHAQSLGDDAFSAIDRELTHLLTRLADAAKEHELPSWWELDPDVLYVPCHPIRNLPNLKQWVKQVLAWVHEPDTSTPAEVPDRELRNVRVSLYNWDKHHVAYSLLRATDVSKLEYEQPK